VVERAAERTERLIGLVELALDVRGQYEDVAPGLARFSRARWLVDFRSRHAPPGGRRRVSERNAGSTGDKYPPLARQNEIVGQD